MHAKIFSVLFCAIALSIAANAQITHIDCNLEISENIVDMVLYLKANKPVNYFVLSMPFYENASLLSLEDSLGKITKYELKNGSLKITTNSSAKRREEIVKMKLELKELAVERFPGIFYAKFSVPAEPNTNVNFYAYGKKIVGFDLSAGFRGSLTNYRLHASGKGPLAICFFYSDKGKRIGKFLVFAENLSEKQISAFEKANELYPIVPAVLGIAIDVNIFPVLVLSDDKYEESINDYSEGSYLKGGLIVIKESSFEEQAVPTIIHELTHAFNAKILAWNQSKASWLDEGLARFVEYLTKKQLGIKTNNLFYGTKKYASGNYIYVLKPVSDWKELIRYYNEGLNFMAEWSAEEAETREFGYAFSELFIREYVSKNGLEKLHKSLQKLLEVEKNVQEGKEFTKIVLDSFGTKLEPCKRESEKEMLACIKELNNFTPKIAKTEALQIGIVEKESTIKLNVMEIRRRVLEEKIQELKNAFNHFILLIKKDVKKILVPKDEMFAQ